MTTYENAEDQYVDVGGARFAYRRFGVSAGVPLVLLMHFRGTMDHWDPALINPIAAVRPVFIMDNAGVGRSGGQVANSFADWAQYTIAVLSALGIKQIDLLGFSMGGAAAQIVTLTAPHLVRRLILAGTTLSIGEGVVQADLGPFFQLKAAKTEEEQKNAFLDTFFEKSETSRNAGLESWRRIVSARKNRVDYIGPEGSKRQAIAFEKFMTTKLCKFGSYDRFHEIKIPVLIANGSNDLLLPSENSYLMWKKLVNAEPHLHLFPDSGHGFLYQYAIEFSRMINDFLDAPASRTSRL
ncbi:putative alpha beta hydrolase fold family protein [Neofusicoccum parvum UCRNP2]|uniref:Putative alpha beta hydrolase fold family protein n=1 Tax=Botryosphaeria parva (strain UCR-NP2) TaxID=1287680 RepID=R1EP59_BOTPV|nr:putative alpha beta hydrolase fold family protein [Neofusicoccum parvum UCRNP2]